MDFVDALELEQPRDRSAKAFIDALLVLVAFC